MERFVIEGGHRLSGTIRPAGNKNAALPLLAATLLTSEPVILRNMPEIGDVVTKRALLGGLGVHISPAGDHSWRFHTPVVRNEDPDPALARRIRTSILLAGPLLARRGHVRLPRPGGDAIGRRRLDRFHRQPARRTGFVLDDHRPPEHAAERLRQIPCEDVGRPTRREADDETQRP